MTDTQTQLQLLRQKAIANTLTTEELREAIRMLREERISATRASAEKKTRAKTKTPDADALLSELDNL